jgi:phosphoglucosamine mutase
VLIRPSGTEPLVRVMVEAKHAETAESMARRIADRIEA